MTISILTWVFECLTFYLKIKITTFNTKLSHLCTSLCWDSTVLHSSLGSHYIIHFTLQANRGERKGFKCYICILKMEQIKPFGIHPLKTHHTTIYWLSYYNTCIIFIREDYMIPLSDIIKIVIPVVFIAIIQNRNKLSCLCTIKLIYFTTISNIWF